MDHQSFLNLTEYCLHFFEYSVFSYLMYYIIDDDWKLMQSIIENLI